MKQYFSKEESKDGMYFKRFLWLMFVYDLSFWFITIGFPTKESYVYWGVINVIIHIYTLSWFSLNFKEYSRFCQVILFMMFLYTIFVFLNFKGEPYSLTSLLRLMYHPTGFLCFLLPFIIHKFVSCESFYILVRFVYKQICIYLLLLIILILSNYVLSQESFNDAYERLHLYIGGGIIFLLFFLQYFNKNEKIKILLAAFISLVISLILARRNVIFTYLLLIASLIYINGKLKSDNKVVYIIKVLTLLTFFAFFLINYFTALFPTLAERALDDTRSGVELEIMYVINQKDALWTGLGLNSFYYSDYVSEVRDFVETGYLNLIFKGGIIYIALFISLLIPRLLNGFFREKTKFSQCSIFYILLFLASFSASNTTMSFSIRYVVFWFLLLTYYHKRFNYNRL